MRRLKLMQIDSSLSAFKTSPAETRSNNSGRYTLLYNNNLQNFTEQNGFCT